jgi:hypothetical protein
MVERRRRIVSLDDEPERPSDVGAPAVAPTAPPKGFVWDVDTARETGKLIDRGLDVVRGVVAGIKAGQGTDLMSKLRELVMAARGEAVPPPVAAQAPPTPVPQANQGGIIEMERRIDPDKLVAFVMAEVDGAIDLLILAKGESPLRDLKPYYTENRGLIARELTKKLMQGIAQAMVLVPKEGVDAKAGS